MMQLDRPLISDEYREMQRKLHENPGYGVASVAYASFVAEALEAADASELLDYGAGKGRLGVALKQRIKRPLTIHYYDPAIPQWSDPPMPCGFVACIDVLEHVEPHLLTNVLDDLQRVTIGFGVFSVHTGPAAKVLPDGRNAHLIQQPAKWWLGKLLDRFDLVKYARVSEGFIVTVQGSAGPGRAA